MCGASERAEFVKGKQFLCFSLLNPVIIFWALTWSQTGGKVGPGLSIASGCLTT